MLRTPKAEVSDQEFVELQQIIEDSGVRVIFAEPQFNTEILDLFVEEHNLTIGELLTDSFAERVNSYFALMRYNRDSLITHLMA